MNALKAIQDNCGLVTYNLGTGKGYSVLELVEAFERVNGIKIPYVIDGRRAGDVPVVYSDPSKAERELGWRAEYGITQDSFCPKTPAKINRDTPDSTHRKQNTELAAAGIAFVVLCQV